MPIDYRGTSISASTHAEITPRHTHQGVHIGAMCVTPFIGTCVTRLGYIICLSTPDGTSLKRASASIIGYPNNILVSAGTKGGVVMMIMVGGERYLFGRGLHAQWNTRRQLPGGRGVLVDALYWTRRRRPGEATYSSIILLDCIYYYCSGNDPGRYFRHRRVRRALRR